MKEHSPTPQEYDPGPCNLSQKIFTVIAQAKMHQIRPSPVVALPGGNCRSWREEVSTVVMGPGSGLGSLTRPPHLSLTQQVVLFSTQFHQRRSSWGRLTIPRSVGKHESYESLSELYINVTVIKQKYQRMTGTIVGLP